MMFIKVTQPADSTIGVSVVWVGRGAKADGLQVIPSDFLVNEGTQNLVLHSGVARRSGVRGKYIYCP
jgi:hypothetical protein